MEVDFEIATDPSQCAKAAWPHFRKQKYGRVINTASAAGLFGSFGQCNYSGTPIIVCDLLYTNILLAAKLAQVGFTETLAKEGLKTTFSPTLLPQSLPRG